MSDAEDIIDILRGLRDSQGITVTKLADLSGYNRSQIIRAEGRKINVSLRQTCDVAAALGYEILLVPKKE